MAGVENLSLVVQAAGVAVGAVRKVFQDGKVGLSDAFVVLGAVQRLKVLAQLQPVELLTEVKDMDANEAKALLEKFFAGVVEA